MTWLRIVIPHMLLTYAWLIIMSLADCQALNTFTVLLVFYLMYGAHVVFFVKKTPSQQRMDIVDFRGAFKNLYYMLWWPWFAAKR